MTEPAGAPRRRSLAALAGIGFACLLAAGLFAGLGVWQVERRAWKLALIERVDQRIHAAPVDAPGPERWTGMTASGDEYRRVRLSGRFLNDREAQVQAVTDHGRGYWVLTPLVADAGFTVLVNRGFVPAERRAPASRRAGQVEAQVTVTGLVRVSEPNGAFLRSNDAAADRWFSRDVAAIAAARGLGEVAPYFIDAEPMPGGADRPIGGLTVIAFSNNHLVYALTWFTLALMALAAGAFVGRDEWRRRVQPKSRPHRMGPAGSDEGARCATGPTL